MRHTTLQGQRQTVQPAADDAHGVGVVSAEPGRPLGPEVRNCTDAELPSIGNYANIQMRTSRVSGTAPNVQIWTSPARELRECTNEHLPTSMRTY